MSFVSREHDHPEIQICKPVEVKEISTGTALIARLDANITPSAVYHHVRFSMQLNLTLSTSNWIYYIISLLGGTSSLFYSCTVPKTETTTARKSINADNRIGQDSARFYGVIIARTMRGRLPQVMACIILPAATSNISVCLTVPKFYTPPRLLTDTGRYKLGSADKPRMGIDANGIINKSFNSKQGPCPSKLTRMNAPSRFVPLSLDFRENPKEPFRCWDHSPGNKIEKSCGI